jgi:hypothetical protein
MNGLSHINPGGLSPHGGYGSMASSTTDVNSYQSLNAGLTIQTREGDVVTLSANMFSELDAYEYSSSGEFSGKKGSMSAAYNEREITLSSGEVFTFSVEGDLSEEELEDIESIVAGVDAIIGEMSEGDMAEAVSAALSMGSYDSISKYEAEITMERSYAAYAEASSATYGRGRGRGLGRMAAAAAEQGQVPEKTDEPGNSFLDRVTALLEEQEQETVAWARQPLSQLFSHHLEALEAPEKNEDNDEVDELDDTNPAEPQSLYQLLEDAAKKVDELINAMMTDLFANTLDEMI